MSEREGGVEEPAVIEVEGIHTEEDKETKITEKENNEEKDHKRGLEEAPEVIENKRHKSEIKEHNESDVNEAKDKPDDVGSTKSKSPVSEPEDLSESKEIKNNHDKTQAEIATTTPETKSTASIFVSSTNSAAFQGGFGSFVKSGFANTPKVNIFGDAGKDGETPTKSVFSGFGSQSASAFSTPAKDTDNIWTSASTPKVNFMIIGYATFQFQLKN